MEATCLSVPVGALAVSREGINPLDPGFEKMEFVDLLRSKAP